MLSQSEQIPAFDSRGNLPPGIYTVPLNVFMQRFSIQKSLRRAKLGNCLQEFLNLVKPYAQEMYIDGSYTTSKVAPGDIDLIVVLSTGCHSDQQFKSKFLVLQRKFREELHIFHRFENAPFPDQDLLEYFQITKAEADKGRIHAKGIISLELKNDKK